jgi:hypothetical protein
LRFFTAKLMIEVQYREGQIPRGAELSQEVQQAERIGAARYGDAQALSRRKHPVTLDDPDDALKERVQRSHCTEYGLYGMRRSVIGGVFRWTGVACHRDAEQSFLVATGRL